MQVTVEYLFSARPLWGSRLISWGTSHLTSTRPVPSHVAVLVQGRWVHESTLDKGVSVMSYDRWKQQHTELYRIPCEQKTREYSEIKKVFRGLAHKKYDRLGLLYLALWVAFTKVFGGSLPSRNRWQDKDRYFCSEAAGALTGIPRSSMLTPVQILDNWRNPLES